MRYSFLIILLLSISGHARAEDFDLRKLYAFQWSNVELPSTIEEKRAIIDFIHSKDSLLLCEGRDSTEYEHFMDYVHFVHINGDHLLDVIYSGEYCGEGVLTYIFLNKGSSYEFVYKDMGEIKHLDIQSKILKEFYIEHSGCCDDISVYAGVCTAYDSANNLRFDCKPGADYSWVKLPSALYPNPKLGNVSVEKLTLRMSPKIENSPYDENYEIHGNIIGTLSNKEKTTIWADEKDSKGRKWYFIQTSLTLGWVMAKYIKIESTKR